MQIEIDAAPDVSVIRTLFREYADSLGFSLDFQDFEGELAALPGFYAPPGGALLLATVDGAPAGCAGLRPLEDSIGELKRVYVRPDARGHGIGRRLTETILAIARDAGYERIRLDTAPGLEIAHGLYERMGFYEIPSYNGNPVPGVRFLELELR
jgi:GNAT superfamily N-acetyltransferase